MEGLPSKTRTELPGDVLKPIMSWLSVLRPVLGRPSGHTPLFFSGSFTHRLQAWSVPSVGSRKEGFQRCKALPRTCLTREQGLLPDHWEPGGSGGKESTHNVGNPGSVPALGRSPEEGNDYPLQYSFLENSMDRGAWWATVPGIGKSRTQITLHSWTVWALIF